MMTRILHLPAVLAMAALVGAGAPVGRAGDVGALPVDLAGAANPFALTLNPSPAARETMVLPAIQRIEEAPVPVVLTAATAAPEKNATEPAADAREAANGKSATQLAEGQVVELLENALRTFTNKEGELHVLRVMNYTPIPIPQKDAIPEVTLVSPNANSRFGSALVSIKDSEERLVLRRNIRFEWEWKRAVWVATENRASGPVESDDFSTEVRDVLNMAGDPILTAPLPSNLVLIRPVAKGDPLLQSNIKPAIAVSRGAAVSAKFRSGALLVTMRAIALENGSLGQTIRVMNPTSRKEIYGKVTHENVVEVIP